MTVEAPLRHHGDAELAPGLVDLAVNIRRRTPPDWLREVLVASLDDVAAYPRADEARRAVAVRHGRPCDEVLLTAGAAEAFVLLARAMRCERPVVVHPQFTEPEAALRAAGRGVQRVLLRAEDGFRLHPAAVPASADLVVVGNPTNPTSVLHPSAIVRALARPGRVLVVDEAFMDAVPGEPESLAGARHVPGLVVVRSLTKTWGLAGLRVGYVLGTPDLIRTLRDVQPPWPVSTPALAAARACSQPNAVTEAERAAHVAATDRAHLLAELAYADVVAEPRGPFVLIHVRDGLRVRETLRHKGFAVRRGDTFPGLGPDWLRVAVREPATSTAFATALREVL